MEIREALEKAAEAAPVEEISTPEPVAEQPPETAQEPVAASESTPEEPTAAATARARDEAGRFARKPATVADVAKAGEAPKASTPTPEAAPPAPPEPEAPKPAPVKAPQSWSPAAREKFATLPNDIQEHVLKRETEITRALQETAEARKFKEQFAETFRPFEPFMAAAGRAPLESLRNLAQTAAALQTAPPQHKAQIIAQMIQGYGVPVDQLDAILAGQQPQQQAQAVDPRQIAAQVRQSIMQDLQQQRQQVVQTKVAQDVESFAANHEFFDDVRDDMADLIAAKAQRGVALSIEQAYNLAVAMHPEISGVMQQRQAAKSAANAQASTQRIKNAASSVRSSPAAAGTAPIKGVRGALEAAAEKLGV